MFPTWMGDIIFVLGEIRNGIFDELHGPEQHLPWQLLPNITNRLID